MTAKLPNVVGRYFDAWVRSDTWDSMHPLDDARFYRFVKSILRYCRHPPGWNLIEALIVDRWREGRQRRALAKTAERFGAMYTLLCEFSRTGDFPDPLIERTNILRYYGRLSAGKTEDAHVRRVMESTWGADWRNRLNDAMKTRRPL